MRAWIIGATLALGLGVSGCAQVAPQPEYAEVARNLHAAQHRPPETIGPDDPMAVALDPVPVPVELTGSQPVEAYIQRALRENRQVQAARFNVLALRERIPQALALDDPMVQSVIWPFPDNGPQFTLMGYMPYELMIAQTFPWFGTLRLRGQVAEQEVRMALYELAAAQLAAVAEVKRAYYDLYFTQRAEVILNENRALAIEFEENALVRYQTGATSQQDVLRAQVAIEEVERDLIEIRQMMAEARAALAQQLHVSPEADLQTLPALPIAGVPDQVERLYRLAVAVNPELQASLAEIARDQREVELARKRYYPDITLGLAYATLSRTNAMSPIADGRDMVGLTVGFNLPIYRRRLDAAFLEAQARTVASAKRYDAQRDATYREVKDLLAQAHAQRDLIELFAASILPKSEQALEVAFSDYNVDRVDFVTLLTAWREVLQIQLQLARLEAELGKALAALERVVGVHLNMHPPDASVLEHAMSPDAGSGEPDDSTPPSPMPIPVPTDVPGPFGPPEPIEP